ncbi:MAG: DUF86 domain-containing protein [Chloroflexota bacterium]|nr:DUF86 domain-containing protein [Chloroflexota bacterium]
MTPVEAEVVQSKLATINENLKLLRPIAKLSFGEYLEQVYHRKAAERLLQTTIEAAVDTNSHLLVGSGFPASADYYQSFMDVAEKLRVFDRAFAEKIAPSTGLRNRLVHEYDELDDAIVFTSIRKTLELYPRYVQAVLLHMQKLAGETESQL